MASRTCYIEEPKGAVRCGRSPKGWGLCSKHYQRFRKHGSPLRAALSATDRFFRKVAVDVNGCWVWQGRRYPHGYGAFSLGHKKLYAHRFVYEQLIGAIPEGLELDHLCRIRYCVNPLHLEPVTHYENLRRSPSFLGRRTACSHGHAYTEQNTWVERTGARHCRTCNRQNKRKQAIAGTRGRGPLGALEA